MNYKTIRRRQQETEKWVQAIAVFNFHRSLLVRYAAICRKKPFLHWFGSAVQNAIRPQPRLLPLAGCKPRISRPSVT